MTSDFKIVEEPKKPISMHPKKFAMWLFLASVGMLFAAWTSAYIVRRAEGDWMNFELPFVFWISSGIILLSSVTMILAYRGAKKNDLKAVKLYLILTIALGVAFLISQVASFGELVKISAYFSGGNPASSFIYVFAGIHGLHIVSAVIYLLVTLQSAIKKRISSENMAQMEMCATYWHFLGGLWLYLFVFLSLYR